MTCRELAQIEYPENITDGEAGGVRGCPHEEPYGYLKKEEGCPGKSMTCTKCWDRKADQEAIEKVMNEVYKNNSVPSELIEPKILAAVEKIEQTEYPPIAEPKILDGGDRTEFESGAVRDMREGKGRCDLMPLDVIADYIVDEILGNIAQFENTGDICHLYFTLNKFNEICWGDIQTMFLEVAKHFEEGAKKYGDDNWRKGIPARIYIDSAVRHYLKWLRGDTDEPHDRAFCWNILCCIWTCKHIPSLNSYDKNALNVDEKTRDIMMHNTATNNARKKELNTNG